MNYKTIYDYSVGLGADGKLVRSKHELVGEKPPAFLFHIHYRIEGGRLRAIHKCYRKAQEDSEVFDMLEKLFVGVDPAEE